MNLDPLRPLTKPVGPSVSAEAFTRIADMYDPASTERDNVRESYLENSISYRVSKRLIEVRRVDGDLVVVDASLKRKPHARAELEKALSDVVSVTGLDLDILPEWQYDQALTVTAAYGPYGTEKTAEQDANRLLLDAVLGDRELRAVTGWIHDTVLLCRGTNWYTIRTYRTGRVKVMQNEAPLHAYACFEETARALAHSLEHDLELPGVTADRFMERGLAMAFVQREAANAMLEQARQSLKARMWASHKAASADPRMKLNLTQLAKNLYTDRGNLSRLQKIAEAGDK